VDRQSLLYSFDPDWDNPSYDQINSISTVKLHALVFDRQFLLTLKGYLAQ
jgi:hypothetical protein